MPLASGTRLGPYEVQSALGAGGMGEVYKARDTRLQRDVAIKVLPGVSATDPERLARFEREAQAVAALSHPNILAIHDFGVVSLASRARPEPDRIVYAVTELLEGETLRERIKPPAGVKTASGLPLRKIVEYGVQIARGLGAAHDKGLVHRDLKPENIFIGKDGHVKILDFGLARQTAAQPASGEAFETTFARALETDPGVVLGTVGYMSPEQVRGEPVDARSDIFAFGAVLYEMLTGRRAFQRYTAAETMTAILKDDPPEYADSRTDLSPALDRTIRHCLEKSPAERFQSARDIAFALESLSGSTVTIPSLAARVDRRRRWLMPAAAVLGIATALGIGFGAGRSMTSGRPQGAVSFSTLTYEPQFIVNARFTPDGQTIVYSAALEGNIPDLFVSRPGTLVPQPLGAKRTTLLSISSKSELAVLTDVRFVNHRVFEGTLARMPIDGAPRLLMEHVHEADWSPDGSSLAVVAVDGFKDRLEYPIGTVLYETSGYISDIRVSPDGNEIAFMDHEQRFDDRGWVKVVDRTRAVRTIAGDYWGEQGLAWSPGGRTVIFAAHTGETYQVHEVSTSGPGDARVVLPSIGTTFLLDVGRDGRWLVTRNDDRLSIRGVLAGSPSEREFPWLNNALAPRLSEDGTILLFTDQSASAGSNYSVGLRKNDGSGVVRVGEGSPLGVSPDNKWALAQLSTPSQLVIYPLGPGQPKRLDRGSLDHLLNARWLPGGKAIIVCGSEPSRQLRCYTQDIEGGVPKPFSPEGVVLGPVSPDGRTAIGLVAGKPPGLWSFGDTAVRAIEGLTIDDEVAEWSRDGRALFVSARRSVPARLERFDLVSGRRTPVRELGPPDRAGLIAMAGISVVDDARTYAYAYWKRVSTLFIVKTSVP